MNEVMGLVGGEDMNRFRCTCTSTAGCLFDFLLKGSYPFFQKGDSFVISHGRHKPQLMHAYLVEIPLGLSTIWKQLQLRRDIDSRRQWDEASL